MKKKQIRRLINLFEYLPLAGGILSGKTIPDADTASQLSEALRMLREIREDPDNTFMIGVLDEIDDNLYRLP